MSNNSSITIGGSIPDAAIGTLIQAAMDDDAALDWSAEYVGALGDEAVAARLRATSGEKLAFFYQEDRIQHAYGTFSHLQATCQTLGLSYLIVDEPNDGCDGSATWWTPGMEKPQNAVTDADGHGFVDVRQLRAALAAPNSLDAVQALADASTTPEIPFFTVV